MHWLPRSVGRKRAGKFKHAGIFSHDPVLPPPHYVNILEIWYIRVLFKYSSSCITSKIPGGMVNKRHITGLG